MIPFELTIIGSGSAKPTLKRKASAQMLTYGENHFLIDCAEGTQLQLNALKISLMRISHIFISHLHGDHYFGLIGLINSLHLIGRTKPLYIFGPEKLAEILQIQLDASETKLRYPLVFNTLQANGKQCILDNVHLEVYSFPVLHRIPTWGFLFNEKLPERNIRPDFIEAFHPNFDEIHAIKSGADFIDTYGNSHANHEISIQHDCRSYAYCTDTAYFEELIDYIKGVKVIYHETTFMANQVERAMATFHSTTLQAAEIALKAGAGKLIIGHFSSRYPTTETLLEETKTVFSNTVAAEDGLKIEL
ncbi:MAG: ribonuclease Z [Bacteroidales bacterium]|nr:ribonuclease Z [Bacteroidales bacterium]